MLVRHQGLSPFLAFAAASGLVFPEAPPIKGCLNISYLCVSKAWSSYLPSLHLRREATVVGPTLSAVPGGVRCYCTVDRERTPPFSLYGISVTKKPSSLRRAR